MKWKTFFEGITSEFRELRKDSDFNDVTLAFDDGQFIETNKLIVSACSPVLRGIIKRNSVSSKHGHQMIYLSGFDSSLLTLLVDFMYQGEIKVSSRDINSFLEAANRLKVQGLATPTEDVPQERKASTNKREPKQIEEADLTSEDLDNSIDTTGDIVDVETNVRKILGSVEDDLDNTKEDNDEAGHPKEDLSSCYESEKCWKCANCNKIFPKEKTLRNHRELLHDIGIMWPCKHCPKSFRVKNSLYAHTWRLHKNGESESPAPVFSKNSPRKKEQASGTHECPKCTKTFPTPKGLAKHIDYYHPKDGVVVDCGICDKQFNTKNSRSAHQYQSHTLEERQMFKEAQAKIKEESLNNVQEEEFVSDEIFESDNDIDSAVTLD